MAVMVSFRVPQDNYLDIYGPSGSLKMNVQGLEFNIDVHRIKNNTSFFAFYVFDNAVKAMRIETKIKKNYGVDPQVKYNV